MVLLSTFARLCWESFIEPCFCSALSLNNSMVGPFGSCICGLTLTSPQLLLSFIQPLPYGHMEKLGCTPGILKKSPHILPALNSSVIHRERDHLKNSCLSRQKGMVLRISRNSQAKASSEEMLHGALVSIRGIWWLLEPPMLVWKPNVLIWWQGSLD
jgi:hypothetical protein